MQLRYDRSSLADSRPYALHRATAHVADGEDSLSMPVSSGSGIRSAAPASAPVRMKPFSSRGIVEPPTPTRRRIGAGEQEQLGDRVLFLGARAPVAPPQDQQTPWSAVPTSSTTSVRTAPRCSGKRRSDR